MSHDDLRDDSEFREAVLPEIRMDRSRTDIFTDLVGTPNSRPGPLQRPEVLARIPVVQELLDHMLDHSLACEDMECERCASIPPSWLGALARRRQQRQHPSSGV